MLTDIDDWHNHNYSKKSKAVCVFVYIIFPHQIEELSECAINLQAFVEWRKRKPKTRQVHIKI